MICIVIMFQIFNRRIVINRELLGLKSYLENIVRSKFQIGNVLDIKDCCGQNVIFRSILCQFILFKIVFGGENEILIIFQDPKINRCTYK